MKTRTKSVVAASLGLIGGAIVAAWTAGYGYMVLYRPEGLEVLGVFVFGFLAAIIGAPLGCYVALRAAGVPRPGVTMVKAVAIAVVVVIGWTSLAGLLTSFDGDPAFVLLAIGATAVPAIVVARQKGWFQGSPSR